MNAIDLLRKIRNTIHVRQHLEDKDPDLLEQIDEVLDEAVPEKEPKGEPIDPDSHHITVQEFDECCESGGFIDDDGFGELATATEVFPGKTVYPSDDPDERDPKYTHVVWYNK